MQQRPEQRNQLGTTGRFGQPQNKNASVELPKVKIDKTTRYLTKGTDSAPGLGIGDWGFVEPT